MPIFDRFFDGVWLTRLVLERGIAAIFLLAFIAVLHQFPALLGERGLLPVPEFVEIAPFKRYPSIFFWRYSDGMLRALAALGTMISVLIMCGVVSPFPWWINLAAWLAMWGIYLSIVNVGQQFYSFGWETMLLEAGFFAAFLGSAHDCASVIPVLMLRWMLFRVEVGAGLIKLRHDRSWRDLTALWYHYETQPLPNPLSWFFHRLPPFIHRLCVLGSHVTQVAVPFGLFAPQPYAAAAGALIIFHQFWLIVSGNYSWLNWLTVVLGASAFGDTVLSGFLLMRAPSELAARSGVNDAALYLLAAAAALLSVKPALNLLSKNQVMNYSFNRLHIVNAYGAFGSVTKERYEIVLEGTSSAEPAPQAPWREYEFKAKPGDPRRMPPQIAPYHLRLDWLMWFLPFSVALRHGAVIVPEYEDWFVALVLKLLQGDRQSIHLLGVNPFPDHPPKFVRARYYRYEYTSAAERRDNGAWWRRTLIGEYLPAVSLGSLNGHAVD
jgi:hypothetical protein